MVLANVLSPLPPASSGDHPQEQPGILLSALRKGLADTGEGMRETAGPPGVVGAVPCGYDAETDTGKPEAGWSPCLEDERYISAILLSALIFAEVIAFILFSVCCWQCCMVY